MRTFFTVRGMGALFLVLLLALLLGAAGLWIWARTSEKPPLLEGIPFSRLILDRHGRPLRLGLAADDIYRLHCRLDEVHPDLVRATLLYEDRWFFMHPGVNPLALSRAFLQTYIKGNRRMGGSTLTMQVARLRFKLRTNSWHGKLAQMLMAFRLEAHYSKRDILEAYFNLAPYGFNVEGAEAASRIYFHTPSIRMAPTEALALAVTPQNPSKRNPFGNSGDNPDLLQARMRLVSAWNTLVPGEAPEQAASTPTTLLTAPLQVYSPAQLPFFAPHVSTELLGISANSSPLRTTLDLRHQQTVEEVLHLFISRNAPFGISNAAALLLHWPDMEIRALAGSADFHKSSIQGQVDISRSRRSPGSTLKPFIYALALDQGVIHPLSLLADTPRIFQGYDPDNMDQQFQGPLPAKTALARSRNIPAITLASKLRYPDLYTFLSQAGVAFEKDSAHYGLSLVLGGAEVTMRELAALYAILPNQGLWREPRLTTGQEPGHSRRVLSPEAAFITLDMLREPGSLRSGPHNERSLSVHLKTGTSNGLRDAWCAGIFGPYVLVVWSGNCDNTPNPLLVGRRLAMPLFLDIAARIAGAEPIQDLCAAPPEGFEGVKIPVCTSTGDTDVSLCPDMTTSTWFIPGVSPVAPTGILRPILIDRDSGLRACRENANTETIIWEFWPGDLAAVFKQAGIHKPPPPDWMPGCGGPSAGTLNTDKHVLRIISPKEGMAYHLSLSQPERNVIPLTADVPADSLVLFWFAGGRSLGQSHPEQALLWTPPPGITEIRVVDDKGRSDRMRLVSETVE